MTKFEEFEADMLGWMLGRALVTAIGFDSHRFDRPRVDPRDLGCLDALLPAEHYLPCHNCGDPVWVEPGTEGPVCCTPCLNGEGDD